MLRLIYIKFYLKRKIQIVNCIQLQALDLWMAGCMVSVFAALAEFVVVKVLDVQYQYQVNKIPKTLPMVRKKFLRIFILTRLSYC